MFKWLLVPSSIKDLHYDGKEDRDLGYDVNQRLCSVLFCSEERQLFSESWATRPIVVKPMLQPLPVFVRIDLVCWDCDVS